MPTAPSKTSSRSPEKPTPGKPSLGNPSREKSTPEKSTTQRDPRDTPAMRQFAAFKAQHPDCILLFRMGDFYELFDDDAVKVSEALGLTLTQRTEGIPMAGVPHHAMESYLRRMIEHGFRVAVCDQIQDPKEAKGVVDRAVTRVVTPGTLVDEPLLDESAMNVIAAIQFTESGDDSAAVLAYGELSTGRLRLRDLPANRIIDELVRLRPNELLYVETANGVTPPRVQAIAEAVGCAVTPRAAWTFRLRDAADMLREHFGVATLSGFGLDDEDLALGPAGALLRFLQETQPGDPNLGSVGLRHLQPPQRESADAYMVIDGTSLRSLEIERTMRSGGVEGSVLSVLQACVTPMGKRQLREWLCYPLQDINAIRQRQDCVAALVQEAEAARSLRKAIGKIRDVARISGRIALRRATPRDLATLGDSVMQLHAVQDILCGWATFTAQHEQLQELAQTLGPLAKRIVEACVDEPPAHLREGGLFRDGIDAKLDEARALQRDGHSWLAEYQRTLIEQTSIPSLKVGYNKVFGYYIEITHAHSAKVPATFTRKQTVKNAERYITGELKDYEDKVTSAHTRALEREKELFDQLCSTASQAAAALAAFADLIACLDVLSCFADAAVRYRYTRPEIVAESIMHIEQGRHPVLDRTLRERFVPNDCSLGGADDQATLSLITGPNMAGKSTFIRQAAIITLMAHTGSFVPAHSARIGLTDHIFTRIGASDEIHSGRSTFMVEMTETANILHHATSRSLVILDEIGRGTSTLDGLSLAWAIAESIAQIGCRALFATHYHELTTLAEQIPNVNNLHVAVREWGEQVVFLYRILPGRTGRSYGIHVARIAGLPRPTIDRASAVLESLVVHTEHSIAADCPTPAPSNAQMGLFTEYVEHPAVNRLREIDVNHVSPVQAFETLRELTEMIRGDAPS